jgi:hypothetical protein
MTSILQGRKELFGHLIEVVHTERTPFQHWKKRFTPATEDLHHETRLFDATRHTFKLLGYIFELGLFG